ncbi:MAG TPA: amidohydrolase family protein [Woeseiaceae bacterium]|nr:amidohydrolase family protein [Woeseiaceae bacterium]
MKHTQARRIHRQDRKFGRAAALSLAAVLLPFPAAGERLYADAHLHYVDFFQASEGIDKVIGKMDESGVTDAVLMGLPITKMWAATEPKRPEYVFADDAKVYWYSLTDEIVARAVMSLPEADRERIHPFICGFNPVDKFAVDHIERMLEWYPGLWAGIGEVMTRHDDLTAFTYGEPPRANHEALHRVYELAARHDLPVLIHSNITSVRMREPLYLGELEEALRKHPQTRFIWAHAGTSDAINRRIELKFLDDEVGRLLETYDNLWVDLSWSVLDEYLLTSDGDDVRKHWLAIIRRHPDRFVIGSDLVGSFDRLGEKMESFDVLLDELSEAQAALVARENLLHILDGPPKTAD